MTARSGYAFSETETFDAGMVHTKPKPATAPAFPVIDSKWKMVGFATPGGLVAWKASGFDAAGAQYTGGGVLTAGSITGSQIL